MIKPNPNIESIHPYIPGKPIEEVKREKGLKQVVKLASNENNWGLPKNVQDKLAQKITELYLYPDGYAFKLRTKLAEKHKLSPDQFIFGNGSDELLQLIALTYLGAGKEAILSDGTFSEYKFSALLLNAPYKKVPLKNYTYDLEAFAKAMTGDTRVIFLCNPNNPTGTYYPKSELDAFLPKVSSETVVVLDEAYFEYASGGDYPDSIEYLEKYPNLIVLRTFSKIWALAGLRLGYGMASPEIIASLNKARQPFNVNAFAQEAAVLMLDEDAWAHTIRQTVDVQRERIYEALDAMNVTYLKSRANFIFIELKRPAKDVFDALLDRGVIVRPMNGFGFTEAIRVTIGLPEENDIFLREFRKIMKK